MVAALRQSGPTIRHYRTFTVFGMIILFCLLLALFDDTAKGAHPLSIAFWAAPVFQDLHTVRTIFKQSFVGTLLVIGTAQMSVTTQVQRGLLANMICTTAIYSLQFHVVRANQ